MPRIARGETAGGIYHIINRGNMKMKVFDDAEDYEDFIELVYNKYNISIELEESLLDVMTKMSLTRGH